MKKISFILFLIIIFSNGILHAWSCNQSCPSAWWSGRAECLTYKRGCKAKADVSKKAEIIKNDINRAVKNAREKVQREAKRAREKVQREAKKARESVQKEAKKKARVIAKKNKVIERDIIKTRESIQRYSAEKTAAIKNKSKVIMQDVDDGYVYQKQKTTRRIEHYQDVIKNTEYNPLKSDRFKSAVENVKQTATLNNAKKGVRKFGKHVVSGIKTTNKIVDNGLISFDKNVLGGKVAAAKQAESVDELWNNKILGGDAQKNARHEAHCINRLNYFKHEASLTNEQAAIIEYFSKSNCRRINNKTVVKQFLKTLKIELKKDIEDNKALLAQSNQDYLSNIFNQVFQRVFENFGITLKRGF